MNPYGVNAHMISNDGLQMLAKIGIGAVRIDFDWDFIQPMKDGFNWAEHDRIVDECQRLGLEVLAVVAYSPKWACGSDNHATPPSNPRDYLSFLLKCVGRYTDRVQAWSVWNEPNLRQFWTGERDQFIWEIWVPGLRVIRDMDPVATIVGPDLSSTRDNRALQTWLPSCLIEGRGLLQVVSHHQYDGHDTVKGRLAEIDNLIETVNKYPGFNSAPVWISEIGWDRVDPNTQGTLLRDTMLGMKPRPQWQRTYWYDSHGPKWGLIENDLSATRPAYDSYARVIKADNPTEGDSRG
jgi:hypothetical protein